MKFPDKFVFNLFVAFETFSPENFLSANVKIKVVLHFPKEDVGRTCAISKPSTDIKKH